MTNPDSSWSEHYAQLQRLRDICQDPSAALYVVAYLTAELSPERVEAAVKSATEWAGANPPLAPLPSIYAEE